MIIAVDGPAGSGKSSVSKIVSSKLGIAYLDTGAMYRMVTLYCLDNEIDVNDEEKVSSVLKDINIDIDSSDFFINGKNVTLDIRQERINKNVSKIASYFDVREFLVEQQRELGNKKDIILDGRDIGTVVFPKADIKFYLDASVEERAKRRVFDNESKGIEEKYEDILLSIQKRDDLDMNREISPLKKADDAILVDTTSMDKDQVIDYMIKKVKDEN